MEVFVFDGRWTLYHVLRCCQTYFVHEMEDHEYEAGGKAGQIESGSTKWGLISLLFHKKRNTCLFVLSLENNLMFPFFQKKKNLINKKCSFFVALASLCLFSPCVGFVVLAGKSLLIFETERSNFCNKFNKTFGMETMRTSFYNCVECFILQICYASFLIRISSWFIMLF